MKQVILAAALCGAALALAGASQADDTSNFLSGSSNAFILGPTGIPTPDATYIGDALRLYLDPNGYDGTFASTLALTTPESYDFGQSVTLGEQALVDAVVDDYKAGGMDCTASGVCSDPLTIFTYSQSSLIASVAEQKLAEADVPSDALRFVMLGANPEAVPDDLYPTDVYNIVGDYFADPGSVGSTWLDILFGLVTHDAYLGLTAAEIDSATMVVDGMTTIYDIPPLTTLELWEALLGASAAG